MSTEIITDLPPQSAEGSYVDEHGLSSADYERRGTVEMGRSRASDIEKLLGLAEDLQQKCEEQQWRLRVICTVIAVMIGFLLRALYTLALSSYSGSASSNASVLLRRENFPITIGLLIVAVPSAIVISNSLGELWAKALLVHLRREQRALNEVLTILQEIDVDMGAKWSPLERATFRIRMSRLDIGSEVRGNVGSLRKSAARRMEALSGNRHP